MNLHYLMIFLKKVKQNTILVIKLLNFMGDCNISVFNFKLFSAFLLFFFLIFATSLKVYPLILYGLF